MDRIEKNYELRGAAVFDVERAVSLLRVPSTYNTSRKANTWTSSGGSGSSSNNSISNSGGLGSSNNFIGASGGGGGAAAPVHNAAAAAAASANPLKRRRPGSPTPHDADAVVGGGGAPATATAAAAAAFVASAHAVRAAYAHWQQRRQQIAPRPLLQRFVRAPPHDAPRDDYTIFRQVDPPLPDLLPVENNLRGV